MSYAELNGIFNGLSGRTGNLVFARTKRGTVVRQRPPDVTAPPTPAQVAVQERMRDAHAAYATLSGSQLEAWREYADTLTEANPFSRRVSRPSANTVFLALATKFLQATPAGTIPLAPPATPFLGDGISVTASNGTEVVDFNASGGNASGVVTELLLQRLATRNRAPQARGYRSEMFAAFTTASPTREVAAEPGWYAPAYRFVKTATGQASDLIPLPLVQVT